MASSRVTGPWLALGAPGNRYRDTLGEQGRQRMYTVRIYGYDAHARGEVLLEEHDFTDEGKARKFADATAEDDGIWVTIDPS